MRTAIVENTQFRNRIVSTFDPDQGISVDHNIGTVNMAGLDVSGEYDVDEDFSLFGTYSYEKTRVVNNNEVPSGLSPTLLARLLHERARLAQRILARVEQGAHGRGNRVGRDSCGGRKLEDAIADARADTRGGTCRRKVREESQGSGSAWDC